MERLRSLQKNLLFSLLFFISCSFGYSQKANLLFHSTLLFRTLPNINAINSNNIWLKLSFKNKFDSKKLFLTINDFSLNKLSDIKGLSFWFKKDLFINIGNLKLLNGKNIKPFLLNLKKHNLLLKLKIIAPQRLLVAKLVLNNRLKIPYTKYFKAEPFKKPFSQKKIKFNSKLKITRVLPEEKITEIDSIKIYFTSSKIFKTYCRLDNGEFTKCNSSIEYVNLPQGDHSVQICGVIWWKDLIQRLMKQPSNPSCSKSVYYSWTVKKEEPIYVSFLETPEELTNINKAKFVFESSIPASFYCSLDSGDYYECSSPLILEDLIEGSHLFTVFAKTLSTSSEAISYNWKIDTTPPEIFIDSINPQQNPTASKDMNISFSVSEPSNITCSLDGILIDKCKSPLILSDLNEGIHTVEFKAIDLALNVSGTYSYKWEIDLSAPIATIRMIDPISSPTNKKYASFEIISEENATFKCSLDNNEVWECEKNVLLENLTDGEHELSVTPIDSALNVGEKAIFKWVVDTISPTIEILSVYPSDKITSERNFEIHFSVSEPSKITCNHNGNNPIECSSPYILNGLSEGRHNLTLVAEDAANNISDKITYEWEIHLIPDIKITHISVLENPTNNNNITFEFVSENATSFLCRLDNKEAVICESPVTYSNLNDGEHQFEVTALNLFGEEGNKASYNWVIDTTPPLVFIEATNPSYSPTANTSLSLQFSSNEAVSFYCSIDNQPFTNCSSTWTTYELNDGIHVFSVYGVDLALNASQSVSYSWTVDSSPLVFTYGPTTVSVTRDSAIIEWSTNRETESVLYYGKSSNPSIWYEISDTNFSKNHSIYLSGLEKFTLYSVYVISKDRDGREIKSSTIGFRTLR